MSATAAAQRLIALPLGTRVVIRRRVMDGLASDVLGYLEACDADRCTVLTRTGPVQVELSTVLAAKPVPEPPPRRPR